MTKITFLIWKLNDICDKRKGQFRSLIFFVFGIIKVKKWTKDILIGSHSRSIFEKNAKIAILDKQTISPINCPNDFNSDQFSIGILNSRRYQNPPTRLSRFRLLENTTLFMGQHSKIGPGFYLSIGNQAKVEIGGWTYIGCGLDLHCRSGITIGDRCMISHNVTFMDYDGHAIEYTTHNEAERTMKVEPNTLNAGRSSSIKIQDDVWIGANATILKGVTISSGAVIASGSVVTKNVDSNCIAAGNPAQIVRRNVRWQQF